MPYIECPFCNEFADFEGEDFPDHASDTTFANCPKCEKEVELSWYAVFEASRPTQPAPDAGESAPLEALSTPEHSATSQNLSTPTQRG